jgi:hypothetical protein
MSIGRFSCGLGIAAVLLDAPTPVHAQAVSLEVGNGQGVSVYGVSIRSPDLHVWSIGSKTELALSALGRLDYWHAPASNGERDHIWDPNASAVLQWRNSPGTLGGIILFGEVTLGVHFLSASTLEAHRMGVRFQFGESLGLGVRFGDRHQYEAGVRAEHRSNAGLSEENQGLTFGSVHLAYYW